MYIRGRGGGLVDRVADSGLYDPSLIPLGEKKENKRERGRGWPFKNSQKLVSRQKNFDLFLNFFYHELIKP